MKSGIFIEIVSNGKKQLQEIGLVVENFEDLDIFTDNIYQVCSKIFNSYMFAPASKENIEQMVEDIKKYVSKITIATVFKNFTKQQIKAFYFGKYRDDIRQYDALETNDDVHYDAEKSTLHVDPRFIIYLILNPKC